MNPDIDERAITAETPEKLALAVAEAKADALLSKLQGKEVLLVTMDQVIVCKGVECHKARNEEEARAYLESYRQGHAASCINGVVVHNTKTGRRVRGLDVSTVTFKHFPDSLIDSIVKKEDAYASGGALLLEEMSEYLDRLEGTQDSVQGLPEKCLRSLLSRAVAPDITHVIFDMDGLLLDTEGVYTECIQKIVDPFGKTFSWEVKANMMGRKGPDAWRYLVEALELQGKLVPEEGLALLDQYTKDRFPKTALMPGVERLIRHLHKHAVPMAVATGSRREMYELKTTLHKELFKLVHHVITGDEVKVGKPSPEIFTTAAARFDGAAEVSPGSILIFEDAPNGIEAALAAGMNVVHVPDQRLPSVCRGGASCELRSLEDFRPEEWGLPAF